MESSNRNQLILLLGSSALRTFTDSFASGLLFAIAMKYVGESIAALTSSMTLLLIFIFSPFFGLFIDRKIFSAKMSGGLYILTGLMMPLFLTKIDFLFILYLNLLFLVIFNIPAALYLSSWSSLVFKGKPATGYALLASIRTLFNIFGTILGSYLVQEDILSYWVDFKFMSSIIVGLLLIFIFSRVDEKVFINNGKKLNGNSKNKILKDPQFLSTTQKGIFSSTFVNYKYFRQSIVKKVSTLDRYVFLFLICIIFFSIVRTFFLTNVAFTVFTIFNKNIFLYTLVINTAALGAFLFYPFNGRIAEKIGYWRFYVIGVVLTPLYFISFLIFTNEILLVILWALPMGVINDVSQIGIISLLTKQEDRNGSIGLVTSSGALGSLLRAFFLGIAVINIKILRFCLVLSIVIPFLILFPLIKIRSKKLQIS